MINFFYKEDFVKSLINRPFKIPIPNYQSSSLYKTLGARRQGSRIPLHDPDEENALILYAPPELSAHDLMKVDKYCTIHLYLKNLKIILNNFFLEIIFQFMSLWIQYSVKY